MSNTNITKLFDSVAGLKKDYKTDWKENTREDWRYDWNKVPGDEQATAPVNTVAPTITGTPVVGATLTANSGTWTGNPTPIYSYIWTVDTVDVETAETFTVSAGDEGKMITLTVTGTNSAGITSVQVTSGPVTAA